MPLALRHRADPAPALDPLPQLVVRRVIDPAFMAALQRRSIPDMAARMADNHHAYVAYLDDAPAAWGWVATQSAEIGELKTSFTLPRGERYLWNFVTLAAFRGKGVYPRLLDAIVRAESAEAELFWVAYAPENHASGAGIRRAGFVLLAEMSFDADAAPAVSSIVVGGGKRASRLLGLTSSDETLTPCWRCVRAGRPAMSCRPETCQCDYQRPEVGCQLSSLRRESA
jgi:GNAT superfamily N-acetyltransferase